MKTSRLKVLPGGAKGKSKVWRNFFRAGAVILALFLVWNSLGYLAIWAAEVTVAAKSEVVTSAPASFFVLRDECLLRAPAAGDYIPLVEDGAKVRKGQVIGRLEAGGSSQPVWAPEAGLVLHSLDGSEGGFPLQAALTPALIEAVAAYIAVPPVPEGVGPVQAGQVIGVIVTNGGYRLLTGLTFHRPDQRQKIEAEDGTSYTLVPRQVLQVQDKFWALWDVAPLSDALGLERVFSGRVITNRQEAVLVPSRAILVKDGVQGVIVLFRGKSVFNPVEVVGSEGKEVAVTGLAHGQRVLTLPWWARLAKRWWLK